MQFPNNTQPYPAELMPLSAVQCFSYSTTLSKAVTGLDPLFYFNISNTNLSPGLSTHYYTGRGLDMHRYVTPMRC